MIQIGIVGFGGMGEVHFLNYEKIPDAKVKAIVTGSEEGRRKAEKYSLASYSSIQEMTEKEDIEVVDICTPTFLHKPHVLEALRAGKHVIVEKPMALHETDAMEMFSAEDEANKLLFVAQVLQFTREMEILRDYVKSGELGKPLDGFFLRTAGKPGWSQGGWLFNKEKSGVIPFDLHIHDLDMIVSLFGEPKSYSYTTSGNMGIGYDEQYRMTYHFDGLSVAAEAAWYNADFPFTQRWRVYFEKGLLVSEGGKLTLYQKDEEPVIFNTEEKVLVSTGINLPPTGMFYNELTHFLDCIRKGISSPVVTREQILTSIRVLEDMVFRDKDGAEN